MTDEMELVLVCSEQCAAQVVGGWRGAAAHPGEACGVCGAVVDSGPEWQILAALLEALGGLPYGEPEPGKHIPSGDDE